VVLASADEVEGFSVTSASTLVTAAAVVTGVPAAAGVLVESVLPPPHAASETIKPAPVSKRVKMVLGEMI